MALRTDQGVPRHFLAGKCDGLPWSAMASGGCSAPRPSPRTAIIYQSMPSS